MIQPPTLIALTNRIEYAKLSLSIAASPSNKLTRFSFASRPHSHTHTCLVPMVYVENQKMQIN